MSFGGGESRRTKVRIIATSGFFEKYKGQECEAIFYAECNPQLNTEQLNPPVEKWQTILQKDVVEV